MDAPPSLFLRETVAPPFPGWGGRYWIFPKLTTDTGIVGYGECYASTVGPKAMRAVIEDVFERHMANENPENIELMFRRAYSAGFTQRPDPTVMGAFSGLELACWDILGKAHNRPVWALLGGKMNARERHVRQVPAQGQRAGRRFFHRAFQTQHARRHRIFVSIARRAAWPSMPWHCRAWPTTWATKSR